MPTPTILLGRMQIREDLTASEAADGSGDRSISLSGQESIPRLPFAAVVRRREDMLALPGQFLPVVFTVKDYLNGFYTINSVTGVIEDWDDDLGVFRWSVDMTRAGTDNDTDIESRLGGALTRVNDFSVVGERSHAPSLTHSAYWTDATVASAVQRTGEEGVIKLYRGMGILVSPRWATTPANYGTGRVRFTDEAGYERAGDSARLAATGWQLSNGLVRVQPLLSGGVLAVAAYTGGAWRTKNWDVLVDGVSVGQFDQCMILDNEYGLVSIRLMKSMAVGRFFMDLTLRRGQRLVEIYLQHEYGSTLKIMRSTTEVGLNTLAGTIVATSNDADGNKYIVGSARTFTADLNGGISKAATTIMDAFVGVVAGGTSAIAGDAAVDLQKQYMGFPSEIVQGVRR